MNKYTITLENLIFGGRHGADTGEKDVPQRFEITTEVTADLREAAKSNDIRDTSDWNILKQTIQNIVENKSFNLVETLAETVANAFLDLKYVSEVTATIKNSMPGKTGFPALCSLKQRDILKLKIIHLLNTNYMRKLLFCECPKKWRQIAPFVLRVVVGVVFFAHGFQKLQTMGVENVAGFFGGLGIPAALFFAWVVTLVELIGGALLIIGVLTRLTSTLLAIDMVVALFLVHAQHGLFISSPSGTGYEFVLVLLAAAVSLSMTGPGRWSIDEKVCRKQRFEKQQQTQ